MRVTASIKAIGLALRDRNFRIYSLGSFVSLIGAWMQRLATGWLAWEMTGSGAWLGVIAFADLFPSVVIAPLAGAAADRWDRLRVMKFTQSLAMLQAALLFVLTVSGTLNIWLLLAAAFFLGVCAAFDQPARLALIPSLIPRPQVNTAVAVNSIIFNLARFIGPACAGALIAGFDVGIAFALNALSLAVFICGLFRLRLAAAESPPGPAGKFAGDFVAGLHYTASHPGIATILVLLLAAAIGARPIEDLLPAFAGGVFAAGPEGLAVLTAAIGIGAIAGAVLLDATTEPLVLTRSLFASTLTLALSNALFVLTDVFWLAGLALVGTGFGLARTTIAAQTLIQISIDERMRGRVLGIYGPIVRGAPALGSLIMGAASERLGLQLPVLAGAVGVGLAWAWTYRRRNRISASF